MTRTNVSARAKWRVGRKVGRTIYAQIGPEPTDDDPLIGLMDTRELAAEAVEDHNAQAALASSVQHDQQKNA